MTNGRSSEVFPMLASGFVDSELVSRLYHRSGARVSSRIEAANNNTDDYNDGGATNGKRILYT